MRRDGTERRGQSMVEFALILPVFILLLVGILDLGRAVYAYNTINNAAREGGRLAIVDQTTADIQAHAAQHAASLGVDPSDVYVDFRKAATPDVVDSCDFGLGKGDIVGCLAVVRVELAYNAATPVISQIVGTVSMAGETRFRVESNCLETTPDQCPIGD